RAAEAPRAEATRETEMTPGTRQATEAIPGPARKAIPGEGPARKAIQGAGTVRMTKVGRAAGRGRVRFRRGCPILGCRPL
ncbi:MAG: hypothetical protein J2P26_08965, partial [Nocardiopsaceae bacterium]|nr:hypothetical protein [Nocardiopsaceae bacterium]